MTTAFVTLISGLLALYCAIELYKHLRGEIFKLNDSVGELDERLVKMEQAQQKRINYQSLEEIEHAMTALMVLQEDLKTRSNMIENAIEHLSKAHTPKKDT